MQVWQRNHAGGNITTRVVHVTDTLFHADAFNQRERTATLDDRLRPTLDLAQARADEMVRRHFDHECQPHLCDDWHAVPGGIVHGGTYPMPCDTVPLPEGTVNVLIVQRGRTAWVDFLRRRLGSIGEQVEFQWDRRFGERRRRRARVIDERRTTDRRGPPPVAWSTLHFVLVYSVDPRR